VASGAKIWAMMSNSFIEMGLGQTTSVYVGDASPSP